MGIPVYFKTCIENYNDICEPVKNQSTVDNLFLDLNCLIHPCCQEEQIESKMIDKIIEKMKLLFDLVKPQKIFYIAIDGPCPKPKMIQQRKRRFLSSQQNKKWDTNAITPGTEFMEKLEKSIIENYSKFNVKSGKTIFSGCYDVGEGEHKIFNYIKKNKIDNNVVYGLDADLIMLSLISTSKNIKLLRETTEYNIENIDSEYIYLNIKNLKKQIINSIKPCNYTQSDETLLYDYIFICFLLGNDFVFNSPSINLRYGGLDTLIQTYKLLCDSYNGNYYIVDKNKKNNINVDNFKQFIYELYKTENQRLSYILKIRNNQEKKFKKIYDNSNDKQRVQDHIPIVYREKEKIIFSDLSDWRNKYYMETIYHENYKNKYEKKIIETRNKISYNYLQCLLWTLEYYINGCSWWRFSYDYNVAPSIKDVYHLLKNNTNIILEKDDNPYTPHEQLINVLPIKSHNLIRQPFELDVIMYPTKPDTCYILKRYKWEGHLILPKL